MVVDVAPLLRGETGKIEIDYMLSPEQLDGVRFDADAHVTGSLTDNAGYMRLTLRAELGYHGVFSLDFERTVVTESMLTEEQKEDLSDEYVLLEGNELDVDEALREELVLGFPTRLLCSEDCPGLCPKCGKPKREGACPPAFS